VAETDLLGIAQSSLAAINKSHAAGDLFRLYLLATREGADFNLAVIPSTFSVRPNRPFDPGYMAALFEAGLNPRRLAMAEATTGARAVTTA
jgi:hypothetical protein